MQLLKRLCNYAAGERTIFSRAGFMAGRDSVRRRERAVIALNAVKRRWLGRL
jgi:hypothetical protein